MNTGMKEQAMSHELYSSLEEMLAPATLSELEGRPIHYVRCLPFKSEDSKSGNRFLKVVTDDGARSQYIVKRVSLAWDWIMRSSEDYYCRAVRVWQSGLLDRLPPTIDHAIVACAQDGEGWAVLMRDVEAGLVPYARFSVADNERFLSALATLHSTFWQRSELGNPSLGLCTLRQLYTILSPQTGDREAGGPDSHPKLILEGWGLLRTLLSEDVADIIERLLEDPQPLCDALARYPRTLIHGDCRHANLGRLRGEPDQVMLLDWQFAAGAPPAVELARYLATNSALLPVSKEAAIECYRVYLAQGLGTHQDESWWQPQLELGLLGGFLQDGWAIMLKATHWAEAWTQESGGPDHWRNDLAWWSEQVRAGEKWL
jgi:hypothetical protein